MRTSDECSQVDDVRLNERAGETISRFAVPFVVVAV